MADLAEENAKLLRQAEYFASDDRIRERAAVWRDKSPEECLAATLEECAAAAFFLGRLDETTLARLRALDEFPPDTLEILSGLRPQR